MTSLVKPSVEVPSGLPGWHNFRVPVPGSDVVCHAGFDDDRPAVWFYSLWVGEGDDEMLITNGELDLSGLPVTPQQVAKVAFLLEVDYAFYR